MLTHYLDDHQLSRNVYFECAIHLLSRQTLSEKEFGDASPLDPALKNGNSSSRSRHIASRLT